MGGSEEGGNRVSGRAEIWRAMDLVSYQQGGVVSRTILDKQKGNVTLFAFDKGQRLSEHTVPYDALVHILEGEAEIVLDGRPYRLTPGEMILMPADKPHAVNGTGRFKMMLTMIRA